MPFEIGDGWYGPLPTVGAVCLFALLILYFAGRCRRA
jgi:hypothetical protein